MTERFSRTELLLGEAAVKRLSECRVAVFGVGGVGGYVVEGLARCGIGALELIDSDTVAESNINRQIIALGSTIGRCKVDVAAERVRDISPETEVVTHRCFFLPENSDTFDFSRYDCVVDAIDTVSGKLAIIEKAKSAGVPVISAMGAGNKLDPTAFRAADISQTKGCPLARVMRLELKKRGIKGVRVVYSEEQPIKPANAEVDPVSKKTVPGSVSFVPSVMGLIIAGEVVKLLTGEKEGFR